MYKGNNNFAGTQHSIKACYIDTPEKDGVQLLCRHPFKRMQYVAGNAKSFKYI